VLKGKDSINDATYDPRADCAIYKDIDIVANLDEALKQTLKRTSEGTSPKPAKHPPTASAS
jgi:hypothetical protein